VTHLRLRWSQRLPFRSDKLGRLADPDVLEVAAIPPLCRKCEIASLATLDLAVVLNLI